jgi:nucleotidyltransferase/DNA polymerase involved in DNA repair
MTHKELAKTLEQHQVLTPRNKTSWSPTQVKDILKKFTPAPPVKDGPLDEFFG